MGRYTHTHVGHAHSALTYALEVPGGSLVALVALDNKGQITSTSITHVPGLTIAAMTKQATSDFGGF